MAGPDVVRWELSALGPGGPYRLAIHHAAGSIVELFDDVTAALLRQGELEDLLTAALASASSSPDSSWVDVESADLESCSPDARATRASPRQRAPRD